MARDPLAGKSRQASFSTLQLARTVDNAKAILLSIFCGIHTVRLSRKAFGHLLLDTFWSIGLVTTSVGSKFIKAGL